MPVVKEVTRTPAAKADADMTAMAASLLIRLLSVSFRRKNAAMTTTGIESFKGAIPKATTA